MPSNQVVMDHSKHFQLQQVTDGVYAAISVPGTGSLGNAAIVDLGDATLVVDAMLTAAAAQDLRKAAESLTGRPVAYVFNTHWHSDHTFGNQVFVPGSLLISTAKTREIMATFLKDRIASHLVQRDALAREIADAEADNQSQPDEKLRREMEWEIASDREYIRMLGELELKLPELTFERELTIHGSRRTVRLTSYGGGHTASDAFLYLPEEKIAVMGDLVLSNHHPVMRIADPEQWLEILDKVEELRVETVIPGHGGVCTLEALHQVKTYIRDLLALAEENVRSGRKPEDIPVPEPYRGWSFTSDFKTNVAALMERINKSAGGD